MIKNKEHDFTYSYSPEEIELIADAENKRFDAIRLKIPKPLDIHSYAEKLLGVTFDYKYLSHNGVPQCVLFYDATTTIVSSRYMPDCKNALEVIEKCKPYEIPVRARTIIVDQSIVDRGWWFKEKFDIGHECGHLILHPNGFTHDDCNYKPHAYGERMTDMNLCEHQASRFSSALLMPREVTIKLFRSLMKIDSILPQTEDEKIISVVEKMSEIFDVSYQAMEYRLVNLKLIFLVENL